MGKIIHMDDERRPGTAVCNPKFKPGKDRSTKDWEKVTCKRCLKKKPGVEEIDVYENKYQANIGKIVAMVMNNFSTTEIAKSLGLSKNTVAKYLEKHRREEDSENFQAFVEVTKIVEQKRTVIANALREFQMSLKDHTDADGKIIRRKASSSQIIDMGSKLMSQIENYEKTANRLGYIGGETSTHEIKGTVTSIAAAADLVALELEKEEREKRAKARAAKKAEQEEDDGDHTE